MALFHGTYWLSGSYFILFRVLSFFLSLFLLTIFIKKTSSLQFANSFVITYHIFKLIYNKTMSINNMSYNCIKNNYLYKV